MAIHDLPNADYDRMRRAKEKSHDDYYGLYMDVMRAIHDTYFDQLQPSQLNVLLFILGRTLRYNKVAQSIFMPQFLGGVRNADQVVISRGTGLSESTVRSSIQAVAKMDLIEVHRCAVERKGAATLYEINCKTILGYMVFDGKTSMPIRELQSIRAKKNAENRLERGSKNYQTPLVKITREENRLYTGDFKSSLSATRSAPAERPLHAREVIEKIQSKGRATRAARIASGAAKLPHLLSREEMQAMLDQIMQMYHPDRPRVVITLKAFGMMRKQLKTNTVPDFRLFLDRTVADWANIHSQHSKARSRQARNGETSALKNALPAAFDFDTVAYRMSYFVKVFTSARVNVTTKAVVVEDKTQLDTVTAELQRTRRALAETQGALIRQTRATRAQPPADDAADDVTPAPRPTRHGPRSQTQVRTRPRAVLTVDTSHQTVDDSFASFVNEVAPK